MCGIVGYVGRTMDDTALEVVMEGLARLEYRGYDSAGVALVTAAGVTSEKRAGKLENLRSALEAHPLAASRTGIGHTRWATHGGPTDGNAHPHHGGGDDRLMGSRGDDAYQGGPGADVVDFRSSYAGPVIVNLSADSAFGDGDDALDSIEHAIGSDYGDLLIGDDASNVLDGGGGDDILRGGAGDDEHVGGRGNDVLFGGPGDDVLEGGNGADGLYGQDGNDTMVGGSGADFLSDSLGTDRFEAAGDPGVVDTISGSTVGDTILKDPEDQVV